MCMYAAGHVYVCVCSCRCVYVWVQLHMGMCIMELHMCLFVYTAVHVYVCVCSCTCVYVCTQLHMCRWVYTAAHQSQSASLVILQLNFFFFWDMVFHWPGAHWLGYTVWSMSSGLCLLSAEITHVFHCFVQLLHECWDLNSSSHAMSHLLTPDKLVEMGE